MTRPPRSRVAARENITPWRVWLLAGLALAMVSAFALPALAAAPAERRAEESLIAFAATTPVGAASQSFGARWVQADPVPVPRELKPDRLIVAGTLGLGTATILVLALSMIDGRVRDRGFHRSRG